MGGFGPLSVQTLFGDTEMTAFTDSLGFNKGTAAFPANVTEVSKFEVVLDFAAIVAARSAAGATALAATDTLQVISLPAGSVVLTAGLQVISAETTNTTGTFDFGFTGGDVDVFTDGLACNALGYGIADLANPAAVTSADTIDILLNTAAPTDCVVKAFAIVANVS
jgi:hypothetical protein